MTDCVASMGTWTSYRFFSVCLSVSYSLFFPVAVNKLLRQAARNLDFV